MQKAAEKYIEKKLGNKSNNEGSSIQLDMKDPNQNKGGIDWTDFNFPPCLRIIHFKPSELKNPQKKVVLMMLALYWIIFSVNILNFINNIVQTEKYEGIRIFYSFLNILIFIPVQLYTMYRGYQGMCYDSTYLFLYKVLQGILILLYFIFSIINAGPFNGFARIKELDNNGLKTATAFAVFESLAYLAATGLGGVTIYLSIIEDKLETCRL